MSKYATTLTVNQGATVADGHYDLTGNLVLAGAVQGSTRDALTLKLTGLYDAKGTSRVEHATVHAHGDGEYRSPHLIAEDVAYTFENTFLVPFAGWKYLDANGDEQDFDPAATVISQDTTVYASWKGDVTDSVVAYANGADDAKPTLLSYPAGETVKVASYEDVLRQNPSFVKEGYHFDHWALDTADKQPVAVGDAIDLTTGSPMLYAVWAVDTYTVASPPTVVSLPRTPCSRRTPPRTSSLSPRMSPVERWQP